MVSPARGAFSSSTPAACSGARYLVGTPKSQLKKFQAALLEEKDWAQVQPCVEVKLVAHPDGAEGEQYVLCR